MNNKKKNRYLLLFILGVTIMLVPQLIIFSNEFGQDSEIKQYIESIAELPDEEIQQFFTEAASINKNEFPAHAVSEASDSDSENHPNTLDNFAEEYPVVDPFTNQMTSGGKQPSLIAEDDVFAFIEIPKIGETLPIYLGATTNNLAKGVAQVTESSLPTGGSGTHSVIAGHRGYYGATFFRYIDQLETGDLFYIHVLNRVLTYKVIGQATIEPDDTSSLGIVDGADLVTLLTCTPYPTDRYRLLVYGSRVYDGIESSEYASASKNTETASRNSEKEPRSDEGISGHDNNTENAEKSGGIETIDGSSTESVDENKVKQNNNEASSTVSVSKLVQFLQPETDVSIAARNHKMINRLIIFVGLLSIAVSFGLIVKNKRKR